MSLILLSSYCFLTAFASNKTLKLKFWHEDSIWEMFLFSLNSFFSNGAEAESLHIEIVKCEDEGLTGFQVHNDSEVNENKVTGNQGSSCRLFEVYRQKRWWTVQVFTYSLWSSQVFVKDNFIFIYIGSPLWRVHHMKLTANPPCSWSPEEQKFLDTFFL